MTANPLALPLVIAVVVAAVFAGLWLRGVSSSKGNRSVLIVRVTGSGGGSGCLSNMPIPIVVRDGKGRIVAGFDSHGIPLPVFLDNGRYQVGIRWCRRCSSKIEVGGVSVVDIFSHGRTCVVRQIY